MLNKCYTRVVQEERGMESVERRDVYFGVRVSPAFKGELQKLAALVSRSLGTRVSQAQALEIAVREAITVREEAAKEIL